MHIHLNLKLGVILVLSHNGRLQPVHLVHFAMHQNQVGGTECTDELRGLDVVCVGRETDVGNLKTHWQTLAIQGNNLFGFGQNVFGQGAFHAISSNQAAILFLEI